MCIFMGLFKKLDSSPTFYLGRRSSNKIFN